MSDMMTFPDTWEDFEKSYGFTDNEEVYTNGARLIPSFRVKQWLGHMPSVQPRKGKWLSGNALYHGVEFKCSVCGETTVESFMYKPRWNFCPMCGADMRGEQE